MIRNKIIIHGDRSGKTMKENRQTQLVEITSEETKLIKKAENEFNYI